MLDSYTESHHIVPKCMGGGNAPENLVELTAEEHYVAHQLLVKMHPDQPRLAKATIFLSINCTGNKAFGWLRRRSAISMLGNKHTLGKKLSAETRAKMSLAARSRPPISEKTRANMSKAHIGIGHSKEARAKMSATRRGVQKSAEHRAKLSASQVGKFISEESRAKMSVAARRRHMIAPRMALGV